MIVAFLILGVFCLIGLRYSPFHEEYLSKNQTTMIKGIFAVIIFFSHSLQYVQISSSFMDVSFQLILRMIGQLMVAVFFFYSGYGIYYSYMNKKDYLNGFLFKRVGMTWFHFFVALCFYFVLNLVLGIEFSFKTHLLALTGWDTIGNSNWFVFDILVLYILEFVVLKYFKYKKFGSLVLVSGLIVGLYILKPSYWYNILLCFPFGIYYAAYKPKVDSFLKNKIRYWIGFFLSFVLFLYCGIKGGLILYNVASCLFVWLVTMFTMKVQIGNKVLKWLGDYSFQIYIYMRIPMILFKYLGWNEHVYMFFVLSFVCTLLIAWVMKCVQSKLDVRLERLVYHD